MGPRLVASLTPRYFENEQCRSSTGSREELEEDQEAFLQFVDDEVPEALDELAGARSRINRMLVWRSCPFPGQLRCQGCFRYSCRPARMRSRPNSNSASLSAPLRRGAIS